MPGLPEGIPTDVLREELGQDEGQQPRAEQKAAPEPYRVVLADPPWSFRTFGEHDHLKSADRYYATMTIEEIKRVPVQPVVAKDAWLLMWTTWPFLPQALEVIEAWGFGYKSGGAWAKQTRTGQAWQFGTGYLFRSASEPLLLAARGKPKWHSKSERNLWVAPIREHSRKPDAVYEMIERASPGPYLEIFARQHRNGWDAWGDETDKFDVT